MEWMNSGLSVGVVGATGAVGCEILGLLLLRGWPIANLVAFGSSRSVGRTIKFGSMDVAIENFDSDHNLGLDIIFFATDSAVSRRFAEKSASLSTLVIDNSSAFRMEPDVPLVIPEINLGVVRPDQWLIANPNCSTIILLMAVAPLRIFGRIRRIVVSTYQSASGAGRDAMVELEESTRAYLKGEGFEPKVLPHPYAFNVFSHNSEIDESGYNGEEVKMIHESRKILGDPEILVNPTCVRVPVLRSHSESITIEFEGPAPGIDEVRRALMEFSGVRVVDDRERNYFPMPNDANGAGDVLVGRIRQDASNRNAISLFACGDQLLKGAALNAVQIAEGLFDRFGLEKYLLSASSS
jgi:aspartate-semialdehyde dehydrogenase